VGRPKTIDRNEVLEAAERVILTAGIGAFSIGAVAKEAGITKGGVQSCFGSKEELTEALVDRWFSREEAAYSSKAGQNGTESDKIRAHVETARNLLSVPDSKICSVLAGLLAQEQSNGRARQWYRQRYETLAANTRDNKKARLAFIASEGMFYMKFLGLFDVDTEEWNEIYDDIQRLAEGSL